MTQKVIAINKKRPEQALEHLCRLTGLEFHTMPESLVNPTLQASQPHTAPQDSAQATLESAPQQQVS